MFYNVNLELDTKANEKQVYMAEDDVVLLYPVNGKSTKQINA